MPDLLADAPALDEVGTWDLATEISSSNFAKDLLDKISPPADTPAKAETPASDKGPETTDTDAGEPKAEAADDREAAGKTYTSEQYERSRAEANRQRDKATEEAKAARADADARAAALAENEFQRGVQLLALQKVEQLILQKGAVDLADTRAAQMAAFDEMKAARSQIIEADVRQVQEQTRQEQISQRDVDAANAKAEAFFYKQANGLQREMATLGVPTFDAETALRDTLFTDKFQKQVERIGRLPAEMQEAAAADLYDEAKEAVRAKGRTLADAQAPRTQAPAPIPQATGVAIPDNPRAAGFDLGAAMENTFGDFDTFSRIMAGKTQ